jgi:16S rRNA processing protein RimM
MVDAETQRCVHHFLFVVLGCPTMSLILKPAELPDDAIELGRITDAWGIKGWMKVHAHNTAQPAALMAAPTWFLQVPTPPYDRAFNTFTGTVALSVSEVKPHADALVAHSMQVLDRTAAEALKGARIFVSRSDFPRSNDPDEFYWVDLIGLSVRNREGMALGTVRDLMATGPHAVLCVAYTQADGSKAERLIPFVSAFVDHVDTTDQLITVDWQPDYS